MKKAAFTLIELLVVIAIIAVLAGIALPVFNKVTEKARATTDANNLKQFGIGVASYLTEHDDQLLGVDDTDPWPKTLQAKYVPNWKVFKSPFDKRADPSTTPYPISYAINVKTFVSAAAASPTTFNGNVTKMVAPSQLIYMAPNVDPAVATVSFVAKTSDDKPTIDPTTLNAAVARGTHANRRQINVLYADSHVSSIPFKEYATSTGTTDDDKRRWDPLGSP